ncbi:MULTISPECIES: hypothetical protein [Acidocella]|uniref:hypothetical protein n=1 Tax=Acidocella TaxID=50709 RepID=UPI00028EECDF|nr:MULTISPECIES: hypothetical protein [Acidocella]EKN01025.1 hypothetical protein MXAZACID_01929 [Acidocella sp. MX-AZ02]WBO60660.1 hypothetical protein GT370_07800 [Acidocella sp. MX-AZ03]
MKNHNPRQEPAKSTPAPRPQTSPPTGGEDLNAKPQRKRITQPAEIETEDTAQNPASFAGF